MWSELQKAFEYSPKYFRKFLSRQRSSLSAKASMTAMKTLERNESSVTSNIRRREPAKPAYSPTMGTTQLNSVPLLSLIEIPWARKQSIIASVLISALLGWATILAWPRTYVSHAELLFQVGRESVALDPSATTGQTMILQKSQEEDINSALQVLQSRRVLELVVDELGADAIMDGALPSKGQPERESSFKRMRAFLKNMLNSVTAVSGLRDDLSSRELAVMELVGSVSFEAPKKSSVVTVEATSQTPEMAQAIADSIVRNFQQLHRTATSTRGSLEFFTAQTELATKRLVGAQDLKRQFLSERKAVSLEAKHDILKQQISAIELDTLIALRDLKQAEAKSRYLAIEIANQDDVTLGAEQNTAGTTWAALRQRVNELELREVKEAVMYNDNNPRLQATRQELAGARQIVANFQTNDQPDTNLVANPLKQKLQEEWNLTESIIAGIRAVIVLRKTQLEQLKTEIDALLSDTNKLAEIEQDISQFSESLRALRSKQEEARVIDDMQLGEVSSVNQFQPATFVERPISPNKKLLMAGFLLLGLMIGVGITYYRELNSGTFRSAEIARLHLEVPLVGEVQESGILRQQKSLLERVRNSPGLLSICQNLLPDILAQSHVPSQALNGISLGVIGIDKGNGASTLALALATTSSEDFQVSTVFVEADRAGRTSAVEFGLNGFPGLLEFAQKKTDLDGCVQPACRQSLSVVSYSGATRSSDRITATSEELFVALREIQQSTELTIVDLPPVTSMDKAVGLAQRLDFLVVVIESEKTQMEAADRFLRNLMNFDVQVVGVVLNKVKPHWLKSLLKVR
jgi:polysaccharide biosynthesis transport protein